MKRKIKSSLIGIGVTLLIVLIFSSLFLTEWNKITNRLNKCHSNGYDGYKDVSGFLESSKYRCYKKISIDNDVGYEYRYSGYID